jgi:hypothetical protein
LKYLTLSADYLQPSLRDELTGESDIDQFELPLELINDIVTWNAEYQQIIPLGRDERRIRASLIDNLDKIGLALADRVASALAEPAKVRYYSEGWLRHLPRGT